ncbi:Long chain acyl-CoA synthetase 7 peroxisomal, partial [Cichlidogyrus casuarinus]
IYDIVIHLLISCNRSLSAIEKLNVCWQLHQGYGSTETGGVVTLAFADDTGSDHVGVPLAGLQVKLGNVPEMELYPCRPGAKPRGEVLVKGPSCSPGYFRDEERTKELFDEDGWLKTGDIGEWDEQGRLCIVDRCKNLFKLSQGEYVAPDRVEGVYATCPLVVQPFLDGKSDSSFAIAIIHPNGERLAERLGHVLRKDTDPVSQSSISMDELCRDANANKLMLSELDTLGRDNGLSGFELAKKVLLVPEPFSVEKGLITATLKPVRSKIRECYANEIRLMYSA